MKIVCPSCEATVRADPARAGEMTACPRCGRQVRIPTPEQFNAVEKPARRIVDYDGPTTIHEARRRDDDATPSETRPEEGRRFCWILAGIGIAWMVLPAPSASGGLTLRLMPAAVAGGGILDVLTQWLPLLIAAVAIVAAYAPRPLRAWLLSIAGGAGIVLFGLRGVAGGEPVAAALEWLSLVCLAGVASWNVLRLGMHRHPRQPCGGYSMAGVVAFALACWLWSLFSGADAPRILAAGPWRLPPASIAEWIFTVAAFAALAGFLAAVGMALLSLSPRESSGLARRILVTLVVAGVLMTVAGGLAGVHETAVVGMLIALTAHAAAEVWKLHVLRDSSQA